MLYAFIIVLFKDVSKHQLFHFVTKNQRGNSDFTLDCFFVMHKNKDSIYSCMIIIRAIEKKMTIDSDTLGNKIANLL